MITGGYRTKRDEATRRWPRSRPQHVPHRPSGCVRQSYLVLYAPQSASEVPAYPSEEVGADELPHRCMTSRQAPGLPRSYRSPGLVLARINGRRRRKPATQRSNRSHLTATSRPRTSADDFNELLTILVVLARQWFLWQRRNRRRLMRRIYWAFFYLVFMYFFCR